MCLGGWFAHDTDMGQHDEQQPCAEHACFCNGAPVSPEKPSDIHAPELSAAALFLPAVIGESATNPISQAEATQFVSSPPAFDRILPLLI
jgi:hypothetical protein